MSTRPPGGDVCATFVRVCADELQSHVSANHGIACDPVAPPYSTLLPNALSYTIPPYARATGAEAGFSFVQSDPFHVHVSPNACHAASRPPNRTTLFTDVSNDMNAPALAEGECAGEATDHAEPFHNHV